MPPIRRARPHQGEQTYYVYDAAGTRVRKSNFSAAGVLIKRALLSRQRLRDLPASTTANGNVTLERETLHVMDDKQRVALVETVTDGHKRRRHFAARDHPALSVR